MNAEPKITADHHGAGNLHDMFEHVTSRLDNFGIDADRVEMDYRGRICIEPEDLMRVLEVEARSGFRSPFALGRALDTRRQYEHMGILAIELDLAAYCDTDKPGEVEAALRHLATHVRELDACYRCLDSTLVMLLPETGSQDEIIGAARRIQTALNGVGVFAHIGAAATRYREGAHGHEYMGSALMALTDAISVPDRIAFAEV